MLSKSCKNPRNAQMVGLVAALSAGIGAAIASWSRDATDPALLASVVGGLLVVAVLVLILRLRG